jgi:tetratricopeptide (TPR) repeat protein
MADDEIVIVEGDGETAKPEESDKVSLGGVTSQEVKRERKSFLPSFHINLDKKNIILLSVSVMLLFVGIGITIYSLTKKSQDENLTIKEILFGSKKPVHETEEKKRPAYDSSTVERLIKKAKALYDSGDKENALKLYGEISMYNESISSYNLGVAKMNEGDYRSAIEYFRVSLQNGDNELPAALNAVVCSVKIKDKKLKRYFLGIAERALPNYVSSPLYSYYYALYQYYQGNYFEALAAINARTSKNFDKELDQIAARIYLLHDDNINTLDSLKKAKSKDQLSQGLLQARDGNYIEAEKTLVGAQKDGANQVKISMALALIYLKTGACVSASNAMTEAASVSDINATNAYPIKVVLRSEAFDSNLVQRKLAEEYMQTPSVIDSIIFYYAPNKLFNPDKTIATIKKGAAGILIDDNKGGAEYLASAAKTSRANEELVRGILYSLNGRVWLANKTFKEMEKEYPTHQILLYNLALTYAQMGDYRLANKYFTKSYNLDQRNPEAGIFAIMTAKMLGINYDKLKIPLDEYFNDQKTHGKVDEITMLYNFVTDSTVGNTDWILKGEKKTSFATAIATILSLKLNKKIQAISYSQDLLKQVPNDIVASAIAMHVGEKMDDIKEFAKKVQSFLLRGAYDKNSIFYGPDLAYKTYINLARVSGLVYIAEQQLEEKLKNENYDRVQLLKGWAVSKVYMKKFSDAYTGFSEVIFQHDNLNPDILFLAGASAIATGKTADAISFFELSKVAEKLNPESLYTLGLLYQEAGNLKLASTQYKQIKDNYISNFFDFELKEKKF